MPLGNKHQTLLPDYLLFWIIMYGITKAIKTQKTKCILWKWKKNSTAFLMIL